MPQATAIIGFVVPLRPYLESRGVAPERVYGPVRSEWPDVDFETATDLNRRIPLDALARLLEVAAEVCGDEAFGVKYASHFPEGTTGVYGHLMLSADTIRGMLDDGIRFVELGISPIHVEARPDEHGTAYRVDLMHAGTTPAIQFGDFLISLLFHRIRRAAGPAWVPLRTCFPHRRPSAQAHADYIHQFGSSMEFDAPVLEFVVSEDVLALPTPQVLPGLRDTVIHAAEKLLDELRSDADFKSIVKRAILRRLRDEELAQLGAVSGELGLSIRTVQKRLKDVNATFEQLLADVRSELAVELLRDSSLPLGMISARLGFSEPSAFTRWFSARFDMPPSEYRQTLGTT